MDRSPQHKPGDFLLDRYFSGADEATREAGRERLSALVSVMLRIATRLALEERAAADSPKQPRRHTIPPVP